MPSRGQLCDLTRHNRGMYTGSSMIDNAHAHSVPPQLRGHCYTVKGNEPLAKRPTSVRLFQADDDDLRPLGKDFASFVREAVREKMNREYE